MPFFGQHYGDILCRVVMEVFTDSSPAEWRIETNLIKRNLLDAAIKWGKLKIMFNNTLECCSMVIGHITIPSLPSMLAIRSKP